MRRAFSRTVAWVALAWLVLPGGAWAQGSRPQAQHLFEQGVAAVKANHLEEARRSFARSLALYPRAATAFDFALVLEQLGDHLRADHVATDLLSGTYGALDPDQRAQVAQLAQTIASVLSVIEIHLRPCEGAVLHVDDRAVTVPSIASGAAGAVIEARAEPGDHAVRLDCANGSTERAVSTTQGGRVRVDLALPTRPTAASRARPTSPAETSHGILASPWFWICAGVVVGAAAVTAVVVVTSNGSSPPPAFGQVSALRF